MVLKSTCGHYNDKSIYWSNCKIYIEIEHSMTFISTITYKVYVYYTFHWVLTLIENGYKWADN